MAKTWQLNELDNNVKIKFLIQYANGYEEEHDHEFMEIAYIVDGKMTQHINDRVYECKKGDFLFFYVGDKHSFKTKGEATILNLIFDPEIFSSMKLDKHFPVDKKIESFVNLPDGDRRRCKELLYIMKYEYDHKQNSFIFILTELLKSIICILLRHGYQQVIMDSRVTKVIELINNNCNITSREMANSLGVSKEYLMKIFKEVMGCTMKDYINKKKCLKALELVKNTDYSIEHIMEEINLSNRTYFYKIFKKNVGCTPGQLRKI